MENPFIVVGLGFWNTFIFPTTSWWIANDIWQGFDEFMNIVLDDAVQVDAKNNKRELGKPDFRRIKPWFMWKNVRWDFIQKSLHEAKIIIDACLKLIYQIAFPATLQILKQTVDADFCSKIFNNFPNQLLTLLR